MDLAVSESRFRPAQWSVPAWPGLAQLLDLVGGWAARVQEGLGFLEEGPEPSRPGLGGEPGGSRSPSPTLFLSPKL